MPLLTLPSLGLIVAPFGSGKTSLVKYLILEQAQKFAGVVIFSNTGRDAWEANYSFLNPLYIYDQWDEDIINRMCALGKRIKKANPDHHLLLIFDDSIGMAKALFTNKESKKLITTLRHYNITLLISTHQLQTEVSTLIRNNVRDLFFFQQSEPGGLKISFETWGLPSVNMNNQKDYQNMITTLPKYHFAHYNTQNHTWETCQLPYPLPDFRLYLHPSDALVEEKKVIFGNAQNYDLSSLERPDDEIMEIPDDDEKNPLYRRMPDPDEEPEQDEQDPIIEELARDLREPPQKPEKKQKRVQEEVPEEPKKKKKKDVVQTLLDQVDSLEDKQFEEVLTKEEKIVRHRILHILKYIVSTPGNPDLQMIKDKNPALIRNDYDKLPFDQLKDIYREFANLKSMDQLISGVHKRYGALERITTQFARSAFDYHGDMTPLTAHLGGMKHESVLDQIAQSDPYTKVKVGPLDQLLNTALPIANTFYTLYLMSKHKEALNKKLDAPLDQSEVLSYMTELVVPAIIE